MDIEHSVFMLFYIYECSAYRVCNFICCIPIPVGFQWAMLIVLLQTNDALVAPLLRLKENYCHVEECERVLMKSKKYNELVILYQTKGLHKKGIF